MSLVGSYDNWSKLEEVWLGDVYPASWYDHLPTEVRDCFQELTERTKQDLNFIQQKLESLGVKVCRPYYESIDHYIDYHTQQLIKPEICPRDLYVTIGQTLFAQKEHPAQSNPWQKHIDYYVEQGSQVEKILSEDHLSLSGSNIVRAGRDLYFDLVHSIDKNYNDPDTRSKLVETFEQKFSNKFKDFRLHLLFNGGHVDGCFALLKPGVILGSVYFDEYKKTFPGWELLNISNPEFRNHNNWQKSHGRELNGKWWLEDLTHSKAFNDHVIKHAQTWIGDYTETFFEVNCLVVDDKNVVIPGENKKVFSALEKLGITAHSVPFRTRTFWDGGMHCITLDIRRQGKCVDLFPGRKENKLTIYN